MSWAWLWWPVDEAAFIFTHQGLQLPMAAFYAYAIRQYRALEGTLGLDSRHHRRRWRAMAWLVLWLFTLNLGFNVAAYIGGWPRGLVRNYREVVRLEDQVAEYATLIDAASEALSIQNRATLPRWIDPAPTEGWLNAARRLIYDVGFAERAGVDLEDPYQAAALAAALRHLALEAGTISLPDAVRMGSEGLIDLRPLPED